MDRYSSFPPLCFTNIYFPLSITNNVYLDSRWPNPRAFGTTVSDNNNFNVYMFAGKGYKPDQFDNNAQRSVENGRVSMVFGGDKQYFWAFYDLP